MKEIADQLKIHNDFAAARDAREKSANRMLKIVGACALTITAIILYDRFS